jgi:hypothetical protein
MSEIKNAAALSELDLPLGNVAFYRRLRDGIRMTLAALPTGNHEALQRWVATGPKQFEQRIAPPQVPEADRSPATIAALLADPEAIARNEAGGADFEELLDKWGEKQFVATRLKNSHPSGKAG